MRAGIGAGAIVAALAALPGCSGPFIEPGAGTDWVPFGPFEKPEEFADDLGMTGPGRILVPDVGEVSLSAEELLPDERVEAEFYAATYDEDVPIVAGVVLTREVAHYRRHSETRFVTRVLRISTEDGPSVLSDLTVHKGGSYDISLDGVSDLGVIAVFLEGELVEGEPGGRALIGVDAARSTSVWQKDGGDPVSSDGRSYFLITEEPGACAKTIEEYDVASGAPTRELTPEEFAEETGERCSAG